jgi:membrane protease YdiL (CAAX protease family)
MLGPLSYTWPALAVTLLALAGWGCRRQLPSLGVRRPCLLDFVVGMTALLAFGAIAIPMGVGLRFLTWQGLSNVDVVRLAASAFMIAVTIALPEELFFRGILDGGLEKVFRRPWVSLVISSLAFGLMHWVRRNALAEQLAYCGLATVAGVFYALARRKGNGLPAAVVTHTLVDVLWKAFFEHRR